MPLKAPVSSDVTVEDRQFRQAIHHLMSFPVEEGNRIETLNNGAAIFPAMLGAIGEARETITLETYVYWTGKIGRDFADALSERAKAGVRVHVIIDAYGGWQLDKSLVDRMRRAGVEVARYHPIHLHQALWKFRKINDRSHRKIMVVDGRIGFTGGVGIADEWMGNADSPDHWRDVHYRIEGPVVGSLQSVFMDHWMESRGCVLLGPAYFPELCAPGAMAAQVVKSTAQVETNNVQALYLYALASARRDIVLATAYFVPDQLVRQAIIACRERGVRVRLILPGPITDYRIVRTASRAMWGEMLEAGVELYEFQPTLYHCKIMIADSHFVSIGSANLDNRSFSLNDECNVNVFDVAFAREQLALVEEDIARSRAVTYDDWKSRPVWEKIKESAATIFQNQL